ncbi:MAG: hypothetical protein QNJ33_13515 [Crocosphaera sp.]|nr:hypothetical protein [Crocosphaera sp.]
MAVNIIAEEWDQNQLISILEKHRQEMIIMNQSMNDLDTQVNNLSAEIKTSMTVSNEKFNFLLNTLRDPAKDGPRLFHIEPINKQFFNLKNWIKEPFRITLWCEHSRLPLPTINNNNTSGVYEIELTREWFQQASPIIRVISITLKLALPMVIPTTKLNTDDTEYKAIAEQLEFGVKSTDSLLKGNDLLDKWGTENDDWEYEPSGSNSVKIIKARGSILKQLHHLLQQKDPSFGGLERVQNKRGDFLWVHPNYVQEY